MSYNMEFNNVKKEYIRVLERRRPYWSPVKHEIRTYKRTHKLKRVEYEPVPITVKLRLEADSKEQLLLRAEDVAQWLNTENEVPLIFDDNPERTHWVVLDGAVDPEEIVSFSTFTVDFISLYKTGRYRTLDVKVAEYDFTIFGQENAPWKSRTLFTADTSRFILTSSTGQISLKYNFIEGDVLVIDYIKRQITVNGVLVDVGLALTSEWFAMKPGKMTIKATHNTEVNYNERYY